MKQETNEEDGGRQVNEANAREKNPRTINVVFKRGKSHREQWWL